MQNCVFCKEQVIKNKLFESNDFYVLENIRPQMKYHFLICSKEHVSNFLQLKNDSLKDLKELTLKIRNYLSTLEKMDSEQLSYRLYTNVNRPFQEILHFHLHFISKGKCTN